MIEAIDTYIYGLIFKMIEPINTYIMMGLSFLGSARALIGITVIFLILFKNKRKAKFVTINLAIVFVLNRFIKYIVRRPRPQALALVIERGYSFPSAHAMVSFAFYGFIIYLIIKSGIKKTTKIISSIFLSILIVLIGISRIYLGVHYATDVFGGFIIATIYLWGFIKFIYLRKKNLYEL